MEPPEIRRALAAAASAASALGLAVADRVVLHNSNKVTARLLPCDTVARIAPIAEQAAQFEIALARQLADHQSPVAALDPRAGDRVHETDGFAITLWTYYPPAAQIPPASYATALERLHTGMRQAGIRTPHFTDRVQEAQDLVASSDRTPDLGAPDRELLSTALRTLREAVTSRGASEQLLHGEPHPGNVLSTPSGPVFIDFETCCRGPIEFDLAHVPEEASAHYAAADQDLLTQCRGLVLAMVAAWRHEPGDQFPDRQRAAHALLTALRQGRPWPSLDRAMRRPDGP